MSTAETQNALAVEQVEPVFIEGHWWNPETGEMIEKEPFRVTDMDSAEWVIEKMLASDSRRSGLEARRQAITEQLDAMIREEGRRRAWLDARFMSELEEFSKTKLDGLKERSFKTPYGTLGFRKQAARTVVREGVETKIDYMIDGPTPFVGLVEWARAQARECLKLTESFQISKLPKDADLPAEFFEAKPESESFYVKTGVK